MLTLVVPCYNEAQRLPLEQYAQFLTAHAGVRVCFVDDGSQDATRAVLDDFCARFPQSAEMLSLPANKGKAEAVRAGMLHVLGSKSHGDYVGFWDADLATPLEEGLRFMDVLQRYERFRCVIGSRWPHLGARIERNMMRQVIACMVAFCIRRYLDFPIYDSQCGAKIFHRDEALNLFTEPFVSRWLFDVELFKRMTILHSHAYPAAHIYEMPLMEWHDIAGSKLKFYHGAKIILELARIAFFYRQPRHEKLFRTKKVVQRRGSMV